MQLAMASPVEAVAGEPADPPLWEGLGDLSYPITTDSDMAQRYFDQGLRLAYAFNHGEAYRAFKKAQALDPGCAMCFWGEAFVLGANINAAMEPGAVQPAFVALTNAKARSAGASARERALIDALATRYSPDPDADPAALAGAYADAMAAAHAQHPDDQDIAVLFADALMNTSPWDYWELDGRTLKGRLGEASAALEGVLADDPDHPGAIHMYIHLTEASATPEKAEPYADRLAALMPAAGHIVHMPSHTYYRIGRYLELAEDQHQGGRGGRGLPGAGGGHGRLSPTATTRTTSTSCWSPRRWRATPSTCCGRPSVWTARSPTRSRRRSAGSRSSCRPPISRTRSSARRTWCSASRIRAIRSRSSRRCGTTPAASRMPPRAISTRRAPRPRASPTSTRAPTSRCCSRGPCRRRTCCGSRGMSSRVASRRRRATSTSAIQEFETAVQIQDSLPYLEPEYWYYPVRQSLGAALLMAGRADEATEVFRAALIDAPNNGWALYGLMQAYDAQDDQPAKAEAEKLFTRAWAGAAPPDLARL